MSREWKPGDVAALVIASKADGRENAGSEAVGIRDNVGSWACGAAIGRMIDDGSVIGARPLVVIDPEDSDQRAKLGDALSRFGFRSYRADASLGDALRSLIAPPKPDEPTGLGAVVEDADGVLYVGLGDHYGGGQLRWKGGRGMKFTSYDRIAAVKVLSEGVTL